MAIWNLGSINLDIVHAVPHLPGAGETLMATGVETYLGGKGAYMSVGAARADAEVIHIGAVGADDGGWAVERLEEDGVDITYIAALDIPTSQALIFVDPDGENTIVLAPGASGEIPQALVQEALTEASTGDWLVIQNETNLQRTAARIGRELGLSVAYAAAPFDADRVEAVLPYLDFLILNAVEADQLQAATGKAPEALGVADVIVTRGADGATWFGESGRRDFPAVKVKAVDTTGAGDTFTGYVLAGLDQGDAMDVAITRAIKAAALMVTRHGTSDVIPSWEEVESFI